MILLHLCFKLNDFDSQLLSYQNVVVLVVVTVVVVVLVVLDLVFENNNRPFNVDGKKLEEST